MDVDFLPSKKQNLYNYQENQRYWRLNFRILTLPTLSIWDIGNKSMVLLFFHFILRAQLVKIRS
ncbi:hypothetical protein QWZ16_16645 [Vibrio ostreicida]|uniref:Uncharacterized protein n=1 Tax=Vibrio ostreicida TaxID=526588 RepID=A0ABT8BXY5_9VIBR|nr:hypothetical protein [Vibrio ostreicida]MDN3611239.1 hypothetical protein [Vibrio ostreicida]